MDIERQRARKRADYRRAREDPERAERYRIRKREYMRGYMRARRARETQSAEEVYNLDSAG